MEVSIFAGMTSKTPITSTMEAVADAIRKDSNLAYITQSYRSTGDKEYKHNAPLFAVACTFNGGKGVNHILRLNYCSLVDIDHAVSDAELQEIPKEKQAEEIAKRLEALREKAIQDPHTMFCYITISGNGLRIIYRYEPPATAGKDKPQDPKLLYYYAFALGNEYYGKLLGKETDPQCKNITRLSGLAYDPKVYHHPDSVPFKAEEINAFRDASLQKNQKQKKLERIKAYYESSIKPMLDKEGIRYEPHNHNNYVMRVGYMMAKKRYPKKDATEWALEAFPEYDGVEQVFKSCFDSMRQSKKERQDNDGGRNRFAGVDEIKEFLDGHTQLRYNEVTARYEVMEKERWGYLQDRHLNTLWANMSMSTRVSKSDMESVIKSDYSPPYHPFREYLDGLEEWREEDGDPISVLAATVKVKEGEGTYPFEVGLRKWLVGMVAGWVDKESVNNVILVFIGEQGAYKTTWFAHLLPPELREYFHTKSNAKRMNKDDIIGLAEFGLVCCEELDTMTPAELNQLKAAVTMEYVNERAAYAHFAEHRKHICSFCGTDNNPEFLSDPTGNRRWLPFEIENIVSPREHPFDHRAIFAQAYALYKSGFRYWFTQEEIQRQNLHNQEFEAPRLEQELVDLYFRKPTEVENGEFVSVARAMQIISSNLSQKLSAVNVGKAFRELGFSPMRTSRCRGFIAIIRTAEDIKRYQVTQALAAKKPPIEPPPTDSDEPF